MKLTLVQAKYFKQKYNINCMPGKFLLPIFHRGFEYADSTQDCLSSR